MWIISIDICHRKMFWLFSFWIHETGHFTNKMFRNKSLWTYHVPKNWVMTEKKMDIVARGFHGKWIKVKRFQKVFFIKTPILSNSLHYNTQDFRGTVTVRANFIFGRCVIEKNFFWNIFTFTNTATLYNTRDQLHERMIPKNLQSAEASKKSFLSFFFYRRARAIVLHDAL